MSATPWWHDPVPDEDPVADARDPRGGTAPFDAAAVAETVAGGLSLVATFLRTAADLGDGREAGAASDGPGTAPDGEAPALGQSGTGHAHPGGECRSCPVCQGLALLRLYRPDAVDLLGDVLDGLASAVRTWAPPAGAEGTDATGPA